MAQLPGSTLTHLECSICGARHECDELQTVCRECGRALFARYDLDVARETLTRAALGRRVASMWRYAEVLPASELAGSVSLGEGMTPLLTAPRLGAELGCSDLLVKDEGGNPTGSFKARGIAAAMAMAKRLGVTDIGMPTAGNAGSAAAAYAARSGITAHVAMPADTPAAIIQEVLHLGADLQLVDGLITDAGRLIADGCREHGWFEMSTLKEPYRVEGKKTMGYELWEQLDGELPDAVLYPTGGGTGLIGMWKAFEEMEAMGLIGSERPRMYVVQSDGCAPDRARLGARRRARRAVAGRSDRRARYPRARPLRRRPDPAHPARERWRGSRRPRRVDRARDAPLRPHRGHRRLPRGRLDARRPRDAASGRDDPAR